MRLTNHSEHDASVDAIVVVEWNRISGAGQQLRAGLDSSQALAHTLARLLAASHSPHNPPANVPSC
eukprot:364280-Chlamydomonas_euryale.AAC.5